MNDTIIINATCLGKYIDGIGIRALNLLRELSQIESSHHFIIYLNRSCTEHVNDIRFPDHCEVRWVSSVVSPDHGFRGHLPRLLYSNFLGMRHWGSTIFLLSQLEAIFFRRNQIITIHDIIPLLFKSLHKKQYFYFKYILRHVLHRARWIITPSHHSKGLLVEKYGLAESKIQVIPCGVRDSLFANTRQRMRTDDGKFILFSGRFVPMKNIAGVLGSFRLIKDRVPHNLVITGHCTKGKSEEVEMALLNEHSIERDRVEFKGHVSAEEMEALLNRASLIVFPSFYEGFGLPPLEGMAHGCPVVVSNVSSLPEVCGDAAEYVDPHDVHNIADGMLKLLTDGDLRKQLVQKGLQQARKFQWKRIVRQHISIFDEALFARRAAIRTGNLKWRLAEVLQANSLLGVMLSSIFKFHVK
ncbi:MAG: hypothetical protein HW412_2138 [Bacteroidetes bacterium]|nr:hypothetical protein [Bacteroidota bacterium]